MQDAPDIKALFVGCFALLIWLALFVLLVVLSAVHGRKLKQHWKVGAVLALALTLMHLPGLILTLTFLDWAELAGRFGNGFGDDRAATIIRGLGIAVSLLVFVLRAVWYVFLYHVSASEWLSVEANALPLLRRTGRPPWRPIAGAFLFGLAAGLASAALFSSLGVTESDAVKQMRALLPGVEELSPIIIALTGLFMLTAIAISEELLFRGVLFGFLARLSKGNKLALGASMIVISLLWALLHLQNTNCPPLKLAQIFVLRIVFCMLARRGLLEAAIAGHVGLNLAALAAGLALQ